MPTAVAGHRADGRVLARTAGSARYLEPPALKVAFTPIGVMMALTFIGLPFVVRTVQPVLQDLEPELEEVAAALGASRWQTFRRVLLPACCLRCDGLYARLRARARGVRLA